MKQTNTQDTKVALVTAGARRIGAAIVKKLHDSGYRVLIHCRSFIEDAHDLAESLNKTRMNSALVLQRELTEPKAASELIAAVTQWAGRLDLLVNNASVFKSSDAQIFNAEDWQILFDIHVKVPFLLSLAAKPFLSKHAGAIINITDIHAEKPLRGYAVYCQTKAALEMQTKALALEWAPEIRVNAVAPGTTLWPEGDNVLSLEQKQKIMTKTPLKIQENADPIAKAILDLAENHWVTGQILKVDGGRHLF